MLEQVQRRADRRVDRGDQGRRGSAAVQGRDARDRPRRAAERRRALARPRRSSWRATLGFPLVIRPSFTLGGVGGGIAYNIEEFRELAERGLELSPVHEILIEESVIGWKEFELEVMRDVRRQLRRHLLDREHRSDGRAHRRQHHRRAGPDADRQGIPADARRGAPHHPPRRRRDRRVEHPVRRQPGERPDDRHRDEPARVAVVGAGVEGDRAFRSRRSPPSSRSAITSTRSRTTSRA